MDLLIRDFPFGFLFNVKTFLSDDDTKPPYCVNEKLRTCQPFLGLQEARKDSNLLLKRLFRYAGTLVQVDLDQVGVPDPLQEAPGAGLAQVVAQRVVDRLDLLRVKVVQEDPVERLAVGLAFLAEAQVVQAPVLVARQDDHLPSRAVARRSGLWPAKAGDGLVTPGVGRLLVKERPEPPVGAGLILEEVATSMSFQRKGLLLMVKWAMCAQVLKGSPGRSEQSRNE